MGFSGCVFRRLGIDQDALAPLGLAVHGAAVFRNMLLRRLLAPI